MNDTKVIKLLVDARALMDHRGLAKGVRCDLDSKGHTTHCLLGFLDRAYEWTNSEFEDYTTAEVAIANVIATTRYGASSGVDTYNNNFQWTRDMDLLGNKEADLLAAWSNAPETTITDLKRVFTLAIKRLRKELVA